MDEAVQRKAKDLTVSSKIINYCNKNGRSEYVCRLLVRKEKGKEEALRCHLPNCDISHDFMKSKC